MLHLLHDHRPTFFGAIVKHERDLFNGHSPRLGELEVGDTGECKIDSDIDGIVSPLNISERNLPSVKSLSKSYRQSSLTGFTN